MCLVELFYFSPRDDETLSFRIFKNGSVRFWAYYEEQDETTHMEILITKEQLIPVLQYFQKVYDGMEEPLLEGSYEDCEEDGNRKRYKPDMYFHFENFSLIDSDLKYLFTELCKFFHIRISEKRMKSEFFLHLVCCKFAAFVLKYIILHDNFLFSKKIWMSGYYWTLTNLKDKLIEDRLIACK